MSSGSYPLVWPILLLLPLLTSVYCADYNAEYFQKYTYKSKYNDSAIFQSTYTKKHLSVLKNETRDLFEYAWDKYMEFGFPYDEVRPLDCKPNKRDSQNKFNTVKNDAMGNYSATLFDSMDTFIIMGNKDKFAEILELIKETYKDFEIDSTIQVFETNIRILGSLLSAHLYAIDPRRGFTIDGYDGFLLKLAYDLGKRLIVTFQHENDEYYSGDEYLKYFVFNYPRTNLKYGPKIDTKLKVEQCTAGATTLTLEFGLLSRLTNDTIFEDISRRTVLDFWSRRTKLDLIPWGFDTSLRAFDDPTTGIGASIDSFYEYALKYSILFNDDLFYDIWLNSYSALLTHSQNNDGIFANLNANNGLATSEWIDSLSAFFPGLQVLSGDLDNAQKLHKVYFKLWNNYGAIPERWNFMPFRSETYFSHLTRGYKDGDLIPGLDDAMTNVVLLKNSIGLEWYPLRPEFIESTYHLYRATKDPFYLRIGEDFLERLREHSIAPCGFTGSLDITTDKPHTREESFVLSETLKYLYLLFDVENKVQQGNTVFTTEGHPFWYDKSLNLYNPLAASSLEEMNKWDEKTVQANEGILNKFFHQETFNLNREFSRLREKFHANIDKVDPIIHRVSDFYSTIPTEDGGIERNYGKRLRVTEREYWSFKNHDQTRMESMLSNQLKGENLKIVKDYLGLNTCQLPQVSPFIQSALLSEDKEFYRLDWVYAMTLRRPPYMPNGRELEVEEGFYQRFVDGYSTCDVEEHSQVWELLISSDDTFNVSPIYRFNYSDDIYLPELEGLRIQLKQLQKQSDNNRSVVHVTKLNGKNIPIGGNVWISPTAVLLFNRDNISLTEDSCIVMDGHVVDNMCLLYL